MLDRIIILSIADTLNKYFKEVFGKNEDDTLPPFDMRTNETCKTPEISTELVFEHLTNLDVNKSIGADGVSPHVLVNCASSLAFPLCYIFDLSLSSGTCPTKWKQANVTPIY
jgi:hypothetical protein